MTQSWKILLPAFAACVALTPLAYAHDFIVKPGATQAEPGDRMAAELIVTEVYLQPGRMPPAESTLEVLTDEGSMPVNVEANDDGNLLEGTFEVPGQAPFILHGYSTRSRENRQPDGETGDPGMLKMEWFSKALINPVAGESGYERKLNDRVEIMPLVNPAELRPGNTMAVKVLFDGEPVSARVGATFDGFSEEEHGYVARTESNEDGVAYFTVTEPGLWFVRTKVSVNEETDTHTKYEGAANFVFSVNAPE